MKLRRNIFAHAVWITGAVVGDLFWHDFAVLKRGRGQGEDTGCVDGRSASAITMVAAAANKCRFLSKWSLL